MDIYVSNLDCNTTRGQLRAAFAAHGAVKAVPVVTDRRTVRYRRLGLVELTDDQECHNAAAYEWPDAGRASHHSHRLTIEENS
jgi:RNA recognition motif-containing protein